MTKEKYKEVLQTQYDDVIKENERRGYEYLQ